MVQVVGKSCNACYYSVEVVKSSVFMYGRGICTLKEYFLIAQIVSQMNCWHAIGLSNIEIYLFVGFWNGLFYICVVDKSLFYLYLLIYWWLGEDCRLLLQYCHNERVMEIKIKKKNDNKSKNTKDWLVEMYTS